MTRGLSSRLAVRDLLVALCVAVILSCKGDSSSTNTSLVGLNVTGNGTGTGSVVASVGGLSCTISAGAATGTCYVQYSAGTTVTLTATPQAGTFTGWSGACSGTTPTCQLTLSATSNVQAGFSGALVGLVVAVSGNGGGTVASSPAGISCSDAAGTQSGICSGSFTSGTAVTLTASQTGQSIFAGWSGDCSGVALQCIVNLTSARSVHASFLIARTLTITGAGAGSGAVASSPAGLSCAIATGVTSGTCQSSFGDGTTVTLTATPDASSAFTGWSGACSGSSPTCTVNIAANVAAQATFTPLRTLTVTGAGAGAGTVTSAPAGINCSVAAGTVTGQCVQSFPDATSVALTATPLAGSTFSGWSGACSGLSCVLSMTSPRAVTATFTGASSAANTTVVVSPSSLPAGSSATVTVTVKDASNNPVAGASVSLSVFSGAALSITQPVGVTNASGVITGTVSGTVAGARTLAATINGSVTAAQHPAVTVTAGSPASMVSSGGFVTTGARFGQNVPSLPAVMVSDAFGNPVVGANVTFSITKGLGFIGDGVNTGTTVVIATNASGIAQLSLWTLTSVAAAGNYNTAIDVNNTVTASLSGVSGSPLPFTTAVTVSYSSDLQTIWNKTTGSIPACSSSGCHGTGGNTPILAGASRGNLTSVYLTPGDSTTFNNSANRLLYRLINGAPVMPPGYTPLPPNVVGIVKAYVKQGAPNN